MEMSSTAATRATGPSLRERALIDAARSGDEDAYAALVEPHRRELRAHCYRMLGSAHDADDAVQDALLRAWRGLPRFEGRSSTRSWLYKITTNACLNAIARQPKGRVLPMDFGPAGDPHDGAGAPLVESVWVEPYPDADLPLADTFAAPDARYDRRESVELAFVAALQHLPPNQRAALIMREVLGFSAKESADTLDTSVASINSADRPGEGLVIVRGNSGAGVAWLGYSASKGGEVVAANPAGQSVFFGRYRSGPEGENCIATDKGDKCLGVALTWMEGFH